MFAFFVDNLLQTQNIDKQRPKLSPQNGQNCPKSILKNLCFLGAVSGVILAPKMIPKWTQNDAQIRLNGTPGRSRGCLEGARDPRKGPYADLGVILVSKMPLKYQKKPLDSPKLSP